MEDPCSKLQEIFHLEEAFYLFYWLANPAAPLAGFPLRYNKLGGQRSLFRFKGGRSMEKEQKEGVTRRWVIKTLPGLACAISLATSGFAGRLWAQTKISKEQAAYQDQPKGNQLCSNCAHFIPPAACAVVAGEISPNGWSKYWAPKK